MTIGVGFLCEDGIVLCTDNQITWPESHKDYQCKISSHLKEHWVMMNTFAGDPDLANSFNGKFRDAMERVPAPYTIAKIQDVIETVLSSLSVLDDHPTDLSTLCGIVIPNKEMRLFRTTGRVVSEVADYSYIGVGDSSLLRHLGQLVSPVQIYPRRVEHAYMLGIYLVLKAKAHIDGCGGDTDVYILRPTGQLEARSGEFHNTEQHLLGIESKVRRVAACFFDKRISAADFDKVLAELVRELKEEHQQIVNK